MGISNAVVPLGGSLTVPQWVKHRVTVWSNNSTARYIPKINKNIHPHNNVQVCVQSSIIHNNQREEITQMFTVRNKGWRPRMWYVYKMKYYSAVKRINYLHKLPKNETWEHYTKEKIMYGNASFHIKCPEWVNI